MIRKLNLYYEHFSNKTLNTKDYFDLILKKIKDDRFTIQSSVGSEYHAVSPDELEGYEDNSVTIFERDGRDYVSINTLCVSFYDIPRDYEEVRDDLINMFGEKAVRYQVIEENQIGEEV